MNVRTIKNKIFKQSSVSLNEVIVKKVWNGFTVTLLGGLSDYERQQMTGDQVNEFRKLEQAKKEEISNLFEYAKVTPSGVFIRTV